MNKHKDGYVFGMDKDLQDKQQAKCDPKKDALAARWIEDVINSTKEEKDYIKQPEDQTIHTWLKDGTVLCELINTIWQTKDGKIKIKKVYKGKVAYQQMENIDKFIKTVKKLDTLVDNDKVTIFETNDLYKEDDMNAFTAGIFTLSSAVRASKKYDPGNSYPVLGPKLNEENKREFTQQQLDASKKIIPLQNAGSIAVEKEKGTDNIVKYGKVGQELGKSVGGISQQNAGSIAVEKELGTDSIVKYAMAGQELGKSYGGVSQQNAGSIAVEKEKGTDNIVRYGKAGQELGKSVGGVSQQSMGSLQTDTGHTLDNVSRALN